jgi:hypothetical protein
LPQADLASTGFGIKGRCNGFLLQVYSGFFNLGLDLLQLLNLGRVAFV